MKLQRIVFECMKFYCIVHSPTNALFINLVIRFKFTLKYAIISLLHISVFNDHVNKVIFLLTHSVKLGRYIYWVMWQHVVERRVCCVQCDSGHYTHGFYNRDEKCLQRGTN